VSVDVPVGSTAADVNPQPEMDLPRDFPEVMKPLVQNVDVDTPEQKSRLVDILYRHQEAISLREELVHTDLVYHRINTGDATPVKQPPRRLPLFAAPEADKCMAEMKEAGVIVPCDGEETEWASPIVLVKKKNGTWRFCIDFRRLNTVTKKATHPPPRVDTTLDGMAGCTRFTSLDLKSAYWQVMVHPDDQAKTAYVVPGHGVHKFVRMPYGLTNAPATFQQLLEKVLPIPKDDNLKNGTGACFAFLDDIIIPSKDVGDGLTGHFTFKWALYSLSLATMTVTN